jgi:type III pantothenate kinase
MTYKVPKVDPNAPVILIDIGNTNIDMATWLKQELRTPLSVPTRDEVGFETALNAHLEAIPKGNLGAVVVASVAPESLARVRDQVRSMTNRDLLIVGDRIPLPLEVDVRDARAVGVDRVCAAAAVFEKLQKTCVVVCFGTAVTVDLIADDGTFLGGAILPGLQLQLRSLHEHTAQLPEVSAAVPETPYGRDTAEAIQTGVCRGLAGAVRAIVEGYATSLNFWPQVVATGGDLAFMSPLCDFIDTQVNHLVLRGVGVAYTRFLAERDAP